MKKYLFIALSMCAVLSCSKAEMNIDKTETLSFTASFDELTKTTLNNDRSQSWLGGDTVIVYDVTDSTTYTKPGVIFTNTSSSPSATATFKLNEGQSFSFEYGHWYYFVHNATIYIGKDGMIRAVYNGYSKDSGKTYKITYDSTKKYGMPDNMIPVAAHLRYLSQEDLSNIAFYNVTALLVVRVTNNSDNAIAVENIKLHTWADNGRTWNAAVFGESEFSTGFPKWGRKYWPCTTWGSVNCEITCNDTIAAHSSCDYSTFMSVVNTVNYSSDSLSVSVYGSGKTVLSTVTKCIHHQSSTGRDYKAGDTKIVNLVCDEIASSASIDPLTSNSCDF